MSKMRRYSLEAPHTSVDRKRRRRARSGLWAAFVAGAAATTAASAPDPWMLSGAVAAAVLGLWLAHSWMKQEGGVPVLVYHSVSCAREWLPWADRIAVRPETFEAHLRALRAAGCSVISTTALIAARRDGTPLPSKPVVIHLDDGYLDNWVAALPLLGLYHAPATLYVSLDFIDSSDFLRPTLADVGEGRAAASDLQWRGYLNWPELQAIQSGGLVEVQPHGVDHGRIITGPRIVDRLNDTNWRHLVWVQWREVAGSKARWHEWPAPPMVALGTALHENDAALAARGWSFEKGRESETAYSERVRNHLTISKRVLEERLDVPVTTFCWPQNRTSALARAVAVDVGYLATTGGCGENRAGEDPTVISRVHVGEVAPGWIRGRGEGLALLATVRTFHGNYYWYFVVLGAHVLGWIYRGVPKSWHRLTA